MIVRPLMSVSETERRFTISARTQESMMSGATLSFHAAAAGLTEINLYASRLLEIGGAVPPAGRCAGDAPGLLSRSAAEISVSPSKAALFTAKPCSAVTD